MGSKNISIREEVYEYLKSIKREDESFSDIILKLKRILLLQGLQTKGRRQFLRPPIKS